jgi:iron complex outermembrane receptor protein
MARRILGSKALRAGLMASAAALMLAGQAWADAEAAADDGGVGLEEVVVTAQKRETNLQDTPIAISTFGADDLKARHVQSMADLGDGSIPSLRVAPFFARNSALTLGMRGIGALGDANQPARDQAVGIYVDGVYLAASRAWVRRSTTWSASRC